MWNYSVHLIYYASSHKKMGFTLMWERVAMYQSAINDVCTWKIGIVKNPNNETIDTLIDRGNCLLE